MRKLGRLLLITIAVAAPSPAAAEPSAKEILAAAKQGDTGAQLALAGVESGLGTMNAWSKINHGNQAYCPPENLAITTEQSEEILRRFIEKNPKYGTDPVGFAMLRAFQWTFPC